MSASESRNLLSSDKDSAHSLKSVVMKHDSISNASADHTHSTLGDGMNPDAVLIKLDDEEDPFSKHIEGDHPPPASKKAALKNFAWAFGKLGFVFTISAAITFVTLYFLLPPVDEEHRADLKIPKNIVELQAVNRLLNKYMEEYYAQVMVSFIVVYLFLQVFSIPGSMWLNILGGALFGVPVSLTVVCILSGFGALGAFLISKTILSVFIRNRWKSRLDKWSKQLNGRSHSWFAYILLLRIAPFPPNWVCNLASPHIGVPWLQFLLGTIVGVAPPSLIHVQAGTTLNQLTSPDDFKIFTVGNVLGLVAIGVGIIILVVVRRYWGGEMKAVADAVEERDDDDERVPLNGDAESAKGLNIAHDEDSDADEDTPLLPTNTAGTASQKGVFGGIGQRFFGQRKAKGKQRS